MEASGLLLSPAALPPEKICPNLASKMGRNYVFGIGNRYRLDDQEIEFR
jgi:hypothetical protein